MEVFVQNLYKIMDSFQVKQVVVGHINTNAEIEASVSPIYDLEISEFNKICVLGIANCDEGVNLLDKLLLLFCFKIGVPFGESSFTSTVLDQDKFDRHLAQDEISPMGIEREDFQLFDSPQTRLLQKRQFQSPKLNW